MKKVFLDANVIFDFINANSEGHIIAKDVMAVVRNLFRNPYTTSTSFAIVYYLIGKIIKPTAKLNTAMKEIFEDFIFIEEDDKIMKKVFTSDFNDLEDGLQYYAALNAGIDLFVTKNTFDFVRPKIPILHPFEFVNYYDNL